MSHSTGRAGRQKPPKPHPDYPLYAHASGRWAKKVRGKTVCFGPWEDPQGALNRWLDQKDDLLAGRRPRTKDGGLTVRDLANKFLHAKKQRVDSGELAPITWRGYVHVCKRLVAVMGDRLVDDLRGDDFDTYRAELAKTLSLVGLRDVVCISRIVFNYGWKAGLFTAPVKYGANFSVPAAKRIRERRVPRMYEAAELRKMLEQADPICRAQILLGLNAGLSCTDIGRLPKSAIAGEWLTYPRVKTGSPRTIPIWPETQRAITEAIALRPKPAKAEFDKLAFLRRDGRCWETAGRDAFSDHFTKFVKHIGLHRPRHGYYTLRHVFETIAGESRDQVAVDAIMGHESGHMRDVYRERISDERLRAVVNVVREWLYAEPVTDAEPEGQIIKFRSAIS